MYVLTKDTMNVMGDIIDEFLYANEDIEEIKKYIKNNIKKAGEYRIKDINNNKEFIFKIEKEKR